MEANGSGENPNGLPLSCLRLIVPPLRLLSAAMWQVAKRRDVLSYDKLQDFVFTLTEAFPGLLAPRQRAQLLLGLRARLILELCKGSVRGAVDLQAVQNHLERLPVSSARAEARDADLERTESTFISLVQSLLKDPTERAYFFQEVFPVEYGPSYDGALHILLWELLSKLEKVFAVPDLKQTVAWLNSDLCAADDGPPTMASDLSQIHQHHKNLGLLKTQCGPSSAIGGCILSAMSIPPSQKVCKAPPVGLEAVHNYHLVNPLAYVEADQYSMVTVYEVEVELGATEVSGDLVETSEEICLQTEDLSAAVSDHDEEEEVEEEVQEEEEQARIDGEHAQEGDGGDVATALETLTVTFVQKDETPHGQNEPDNNLTALPVTEAEEVVTMAERSQRCAEPIRSQEEQGSTDALLLPGSCDGHNGSESIGGELEPANESTCTGQEGCGSTAEEEPPSEHPPSPSLGGEDRSSCHLHMETLTNSSQQIMKKVDASIAPSVIAIKGLNTDNSGEQVSIIFTCPQCPFYHRKGGGGEEDEEEEQEQEEEEENAPPHIHMQSVPAEEFRALMAAKSDGAEFVPTPGATDQIFTSIKVLPHGHSETARKEANPDRPEDPDGDGGGDDPSLSPGRREALTCGTCGRTFTRTADVRRHQLTHTGERPFRCSQCERTFQHSWDLAKHEARHHGAAVAFACTACGSSFGNLRRLTAHHREAHAGQSRLPQICSICGRSFAAAAELLEHRRSHGDQQRYPCRQCGDTFDTMQARSQHRQSHHAKRQFECPHCDKTYTRRSDVTRHQATHTGDRPHQCGRCGKRFSLRFMLAKHLRVHTGDRPHQCSHCPKRFTLVSILARHERMHTGEKPFLCAHCGKGFLSQGELSKHQRSHVDDKPYACIQCDKRFKSKRSQREHVLSHTGARPYLCTHCGKGFTKLYALTRHNLIHTGERPFPCAHCGKAFLTPGEAQLHQRIHTGERPYACGACHLKFKSSSELGRHKRSHAAAAAKARGLSCEQCGKSFSSQGRLTKHVDGHAAAQQGAPPQGSPSADCGQQGAPSAD